MSNKNTSLKSGIRDNLLRETVHDFLEQEIKDGSALSIVSAYFTIYAYEKMQHSLNKIEELRFLFGDPELVKDVKEKVLAKLKQIGQDHPSELVYYKTLYELFREEIETRKTNEQTRACALPEKTPRKLDTLSSL